MTKTGEPLYYGRPDRYQGNLVVSPEGKVCVIRHPFYRPYIPSGRCYISCLPDELLLEIFKNFDGAISDGNGMRKFACGSRFAQCISLSVVCKRWNRLCKPLLLHSLYVGSTREIPSRAPSLVKKFQCDPSLSCYVQELTVWAVKRTAWPYKDLVTVISQCKLLRKLELYLDIMKDSLALIQVAGTLSCLQELKISEYRGSLGHLLQNLKQPSLRALHMSFCSLQHPAADGNPHLGEEPGELPSRDLGLYEQADDIGTAGSDAKSAFIELTIRQRGALSEATEILVRQSQRLEIISLGCFSSWSDLGRLQRILDVHRSTLHTISLSQVSRDLPDLFAFSSLRRLDINDSQVRTRSLAVTSSRLPCSLEYLTFRSVPSDGIIYDRLKYGSRKGLSLWLFDLAVCLRNQNGGTNTLRTIGVKLADIWWETHPPVQFGPYEFLEDATRRLVELGTSLDLTEPRYSRDEWQTRFARAERKHRGWNRAQLRIEEGKII